MNAAIVPNQHVEIQFTFYTHKTHEGVIEVSYESKHENICPTFHIVIEVQN